MTQSEIVTEIIAPHVASVTLNRPAVYNALNLQGWMDLRKAFEKLSAGSDLRCIVLRGAGEKAFCTGADIGEFETVRRTSREARDYGVAVHAAWNAILDCPIPVVARIDGLCVGGGLETACHADLRIASANSRYGIPVKKLGLVLAPEEMHPVATLIGPSRTADLLYRGRLIDAQTALHWGLISAVAQEGDLDAEVDRVVEDIVSGSPLVARWHKSFLARYRSRAEFSEHEIQEGYACYDTQDFRIGYRAFLEKKKPEFIGK